jgi:hypothetical protein
VSSASQGTILAGRYRLGQRIQTDPDGALWRARDDTLDRPVWVRVLRAGHPFAADVADAARRAALVDDPRLVRVLDVGSDRNVTFVVTENITGESLATATERGPLPGPAIRRIIGEVAEGLGGAAARGLHHLRLTPRSVMICSDGSVKLIGTAVEAAAAGLEPDRAASAVRTDAVGLIALLYSGLTGRWPLGDAGFPPAPHGEAGPISPADLVRDVPQDLNTLCAETLGRHNDGPRSPSEVARQLAPWPSATAVVTATAASVPSASSTQTSRTAPAVTRSTSGPRKPAPANSLFAPITPVSPDAIREARGLAKPSSPPPGSARAGGRAAPYEAERSQREQDLVVPPSAPTQPVRMDQLPGRAPAPPRAAQGGGVRDRRDKYNRQPLDTGEMLMPWSGTWTPAPRSTIPPGATGPFPILIPADPPPHRQSRLVLAGVAAALVVGLILAAFSLRDFGSSRGPGSQAVAPVTSTSDDQAPPATTASAPPSVTATTPPASTSARPVTAGIRAIDPMGDQDENSRDAPNVLDGKRSTEWRSDTYRAAAFGGLKKGLGLVITLKKPAIVREVSIDVRGSGGTVELRRSSTGDLTGSSVLDTAALTGGPVTLASNSTNQFNYVIIWFTKLPKAGGKYRLEVSEVRVR